MKKKLMESWDDEEVLEALVEHFSSEENLEGDDILALREEIEGSLDLDGGDYSSYGDCGKFTALDVDYNIINGSEEAHNIAVQVVEDRFEDEPESFITEDLASQFLRFYPGDIRAIANEEAESKLEYIKDSIEKEDFEEACYDLDIIYSDYEEGLNSEDETIKEETKEELIEVLEKAYEEKLEEEADSIAELLEKDPVQYFVHDLGAYKDAAELSKASFIKFDSKQAAEYVVHNDGWENTLSNYDGKSIEIDDYVIFRV